MALFKKKNIFFLILTLVIVSGGYVFFGNGANSKPTSAGFENPTPPSKEALSREIVEEVSLSNDPSSAHVNLDEIVRVLGKDGIPSIDSPLFETTDSASVWLSDDDRVFVLKMSDVVKIYPQKILNWHEIVNDWIYDKAIAVTFCPLCGSSVAFERVVNGTITEFGVSGKLHQNDLIMYDRLEGSLWQQITGEAIIGTAAQRNEELSPVVLTTLPFLEAKTKYPNAYILSSNTGYSRDYDAYPYGSYEENTQIEVTPQDVDEKLHPKTWVYGIEVDGKSMAFMEEDLINKEEIVYKNVKAAYSDGEAQFINTDTKEEITPTRLFWFAWAAFHPETVIVNN